QPAQADVPPLRAGSSGLRIQLLNERFSSAFAERRQNYGKGTPKETGSDGAQGTKRHRAQSEKASQHATKIDMAAVAQCRDHAHGTFSCEPRLGDTGQRVHKYPARPGPI